MQPVVGGRFGERIQRAGRLVEQQQRTAVRREHAARQTQALALALAARQVGAALRDRCVQPERQHVDHAVQRRDPRRCVHLGVGIAEVECDVFAQCRLEDLRLLRDQRGAAAQRAQTRHGDTVDLDVTVRRFGQPGEQPQQRALTGAAGPHQRHPFAGVQSQRQLVQAGVLAIVRLARARMAV